MERSRYDRLETKTKGQKRKKIGNIIRDETKKLPAKETYEKEKSQRLPLEDGYRSSSSKEDGEISSSSEDDKLTHRSKRQKLLSDTNLHSEEQSSSEPASEFDPET